MNEIFSGLNFFIKVHKDANTTINLLGIKTIRSNNYHLFDSGFINCWIYTDNAYNQRNG